MNRLILSLVILLAAQCALAETITSIGASNCQRWIDARALERKTADPFDRALAMIDRAWILGFMTAMNATHPGAKDLLKNVNANTIADWMDQYCKKNPKSDLFDGGSVLYKELIRVTTE